MQVLSTQDCDTARYLEQQPIQWLADHCKIVPKQGGCVVPLDVNSAQIVVLKVVMHCLRNNIPIRLIILKARQEGMTTLIIALIYMWCNIIEFHDGLVSAHKTTSSVEIFNKIRLFQDMNPSKRPERYDSKDEVTYQPPHYSSMKVKTAGQEDLGRGTVIHRFLGSEVAFWRTPAKTLLSVMQCIPDLPGTMVVLESTANGMGGEFHDRWEAAKPLPGCKFMTMPKSKSEYIAIFLPWHTFEEYTAVVPVGFERTEEECVEAAKYGLTDGQLQWRRNKIANECGGDTDLFKQEYPGNDREAFLLSGRSVFSATKIMELMEKTFDPMKRGMFCPIITPVKPDPDYPDMPTHTTDYSSATWRDDERGCVEIWEEPVPGRLYAMGLDTAEGLDPEEANDPDADSGHVIDVLEQRVVAKICGQMDTDEFGAQSAMLGWYYNEALLGVEINNTSGGATRERLKQIRYPNLYRRKKYDKVTNEWTEKIGFSTDKVTRGLLLMDEIRAVREDWLDIPSQQTVKQLSTLITDKTGKVVAHPGEKDDDVFSLGITLQMAIHAAGTENCQIYGGLMQIVPPKTLVSPHVPEDFKADDLAYNEIEDNCEDLEDDD